MVSYVTDYKPKQQQQKLNHSLLVLSSITLTMGRMSRLCEQRSYH